MDEEAANFASVEIFQRSMRGVPAPGVFLVLFLSPPKIAINMELSVKILIIFTMYDMIVLSESKKILHTGKFC